MQRFLRILKAPNKMSKNYDNWERLVTAVVRKQQLRELAMCPSMDSTYSSNISIGSSDHSEYSFRSIPSFHESLDYDEESFINLPAVEERPSPPSREDKTSSSESQSFVLLESNGKICYMSGARELQILMRRTPQFWEWTTHPNSRFSEVAVLHYGRELDIRGRIKTQKLSPSTLYAAFLVFKLTTWSKGLESANAVINFFDKDSDRDAEEISHCVYLQPGNSYSGSNAIRRVDGWMELEMGNFYTDEHDRAVEARLLERISWKTGLIVEGIEFRPLLSESPLVHQERFQLVVTKSPDDEENEEIMIDVSLLQKFAPLHDHNIEDSQTSTTSMSSAIAPCGTSQFHSKESSLRRMVSDEDLSSNSDVGKLDLVIEPSLESHDTTYSSADRFCPNWNVKKNSSLQDKGVGVEMMAKLLLPQDESSLTSLTREELFYGGYDRLSELVYFFHGMKRMVEVKDTEADDLKQKLLKSEVEVQLSLAAKDSELEELREKVAMLKCEVEKAKQYAKEEVSKAVENIKQVERKLEDFEVQAGRAVENYKNSEELKVDKHKFASKAFAIGFELCKKQVLEVYPNFDMNRLDVKRLELKIQTLQ